MGWASGSYIAQDLWNKIKDNIIPEKRKDTAEEIYQAFCNEDADDWDYKSQLLIDAGYIWNEEKSTYVREVQ
jgi:hypothetical protein